MRDDWLSTTLRDIAEEDARQGAVVIDERLAAAFRARTRRPTRASAAVGLILIATLVTGFGIGFWQMRRAPRPVRTEVTTAFFPLTYRAVPAADLQMVRLVLPRSSMVAAMGKVKRQGRAALLSLTLLGLLITAFSLSRWLPLSYFLIFCSGAALMSVFAMVSSLVQTITTDDMRGRVMSARAASARHSGSIDASSASGRTSTS